MILIRKNNDRYNANHGWLNARHSFSFAEYYDPNNMMFGPLRVLNDDIVAPGKGFGMHPHKEMEIVTIILDGQLEHQDNAGHSEIIEFGQVQRMSAGTGIYHSEINPSLERSVNLLQLWFLPEVNGLKPSYESISFNKDQLINQLLPVVQKNSNKQDVATIHQDLSIYLSDLEEGQNLEFSQSVNRRTYLFVIEGEVSVNDVLLERRDDARITEEEKLVIKANQTSRFMLIDLP
ncbi:pirin family protein [Bacillus sp. RG28]|uniref:Pirin family protein n=1 Tax=Gottfriedia endophytica TaxID=2820819 RepID=A0A940SL61_9BACI|nr:pirin family protein [Gottfriedia endophytica]MBP0727141.1 pirin family protein [Gottfriedia endophytica]